MFVVTKSQMYILCNVIPQDDTRKKIHHRG